MKTLIVVAHPREASLTQAIARSFAAALERNGHAVEWADLVREGFDPALGSPDEPDWTNPAKVYSPAVRAEMARIERNEATVLVFPVWWWSLPAVLKGWIDRVWNFGFAYGPRTYPHRRVWLLGVAGAARASYAERDYDGAMRTQLETGILEYCGIPERRFELLYGTIEGPTDPALLLARAGELGAEF